MLISGTKRKTTKRNLNKKKPRTKPAKSSNLNLNDEVKSGKNARKPKTLSQSVPVGNLDLKPEGKHANLKAFLEKKKKGQILGTSAVSSGSKQSEISESGAIQVATKPSTNGKETGDIEQENVLHDAPKQGDVEVIGEMKATFPIVLGEEVKCNVKVVEVVNELMPETESRASISTEEGARPRDTSGSGIVCRPTFEILENVRTETSETILVTSDPTCTDSNNILETNNENSVKIVGSEKPNVTEDKVTVDVDQNPIGAGMDVIVNEPDSETAVRELEVAEKPQDVFTPLEDVKDTMVVAKDVKVVEDVKVPVVDNVRVDEESVKADVKVAEEDVMTADKEVEVLSVCKAPKKKKSELDHILSFNKLLSSFEGAYVSPRKAAVAAKIKIENSSISWGTRKSGSRNSKGKAVIDDNPLIQNTIAKPEDINVSENVKQENLTDTQDSIIHPGVADQAETEETITLPKGKSEEAAMKPDASELCETGVTLINQENVCETVTVSASMKKTDDATSIQVSISPEVEMVCEEIAREEPKERCEDVETGRCEDVETGRCEDVETGRCEDAETGRCEDAETGRCEDVETGRCEDAETGRCEDVETGRCEDAETGRCEDVETGRCEDVETGRCEDAETGRCEDVETGRCEDVETGRCEDVETGRCEDAETGETKPDERVVSSGEAENVGTSPTITDCQKNVLELSVSSVTLEDPDVVPKQNTEVVHKSENDRTKSETSIKIDPAQDKMVKEEETPGDNDISKADISCGAAELKSKPKRQRRPSKKMLDSLDSIKLDIPLRRSRRKSAMSSSLASYILESSRSETKTSAPSALGNSQAQDLSIEMTTSLPKNTAKSKGLSENQENSEISPQKKPDQIIFIPNPKDSNDQSEETCSPDIKVLPLKKEPSSATCTSTKATRKTPKKFTVIKKPPATTKVARCSVRTKKSTKKPKKVKQSSPPTATCNLNSEETESETETKNLNGFSQRCKDNSTLPLTREALESSEANTSIDEEIEVGESLRNSDPPPDMSSTAAPSAGAADCQTGNLVTSPFSCQSDSTGQINLTGNIPVKNTGLSVNQPSTAPMLKPGSTVYIISNPGSNNLSNNIDFRQVGSLLRSLNFSQMNQSLLGNQGKNPSQRILLPNIQNRNSPVPMMAYRCNPISPVVAPSQSGQSGVSLSNRNIFQLHSPTLPQQTLSGLTVAASPQITSAAKTVSSAVPIQQNKKSNQINCQQLAADKGSTVERRQTYANVTQQLMNGLAQQPLTPGNTQTEDAALQETSRKSAQPQGPQIETRSTYAGAAQQLLKDLAAMSVKQVGSKTDLASK